MRYAAVSCLRDSPGILSGIVEHAKDLYELGPEYEGGHIVCIISVLTMNGVSDCVGNFETTASTDFVR